MRGKIGKVQAEVLRCLKDHGQWFRGCGWVWNTHSGTERILDSLVKRGLVETGTHWSGHDRSRGTTYYKLKEKDNGD